MANYAKVKLNGPAALPEGVRFDINILGVLVSFNSTTYDGGFDTTWAFSQQRQAEFGSIDASANAAKIAAAISGYLSSIGESRNSVRSWSSTDGMGFPNGVFVEMVAKEYSDALNIASATVVNGAGTATFANVYNNANPPTVTAQLSHATCYGSSTGNILLEITGGVAPYSVKWSDGSTDLSRTGLPAGSYTYTVTDSAETNYTSGAHPGEVTQTVALNQNNEISVTAATDDDSIALTVDGGVAPYTFKWSNGSTAKDQFGLAAGRYEVTVTDSVGCSKAFSFTLGLARFYFSYNPILLPLRAAQPETKPNLTFLCEVWVEKEYLSDAWEKVATLEHVADRDGSTVFDVQEFLQPYVQAHFPEPGQNTVSMAEGVFKRFYLRHTEKYGLEPEPGDFTIEDNRYVVRGGLGFEQQPSERFFTSFLPTQKPFLSWLPVQKLATIEQPEFLYLLLHQNGISSFNVRCRITYTDGSLATFIAFSQAGCTRFEVYCIPAGFAALGITPPVDKVVEKWEVWAEDGTGTAISEIRTYQLDTRYVRSRRYLLYTNSLGGINTLSCKVKDGKELEVGSETMQRLLNAGYNPALGDTETTTVSAEPVLNLTTGYLASQAELEALTDFVLSKEVRLLEQGRYRAGTKQLKKFTVQDEESSLKYLDFDFVLPVEKHYTPTL